MSFLKNLTELNLSANNFASDSILVSAPDLIKALGSIPNLKYLNLSRNKFKAFHADTLVDGTYYPSLEHLNMSYNLVED